jgi:hypothetical protein
MTDFKNPEYEIEANSTNPPIRHILFAVTTVFFLVISFYSIQDMNFKKALLDSNLIYFIMTMLAFISIFTTIIGNIYKYNEIKESIKYLNDQNELNDRPKEKYVYTKTLWVYPLVAFIYFIILIIFLIIINHKCAIFKNTLSNFV